MADAELEADVRLRRVLEARVFDLAGDLVYEKEKGFSLAGVFRGKRVGCCILILVLSEVVVLLGLARVRARKRTQRLGSERREGLAVDPLFPKDPNFVQAGGRAMWGVMCGCDQLARKQKAC